MIAIKHGIPKHDYFSIVLPENKENSYKAFNWQNQSNYEYPTVELTDPVTNKVQLARPLEVLKFNVDEMPTYLTLLSYGHVPADLAQVLKKRYPSLQFPGALVEFWLLVKI